MGCTEGLARIFVFIVNFAFVLVGLALLIVGILYKVSFNKITDAIPPDYSAVQYVPTIAIIIGAIIFFIAFLGCCGACRGNTCMLTSYGSVLVLIFIIQVALGIFAFIQIKDKAELKLKIDQEINVVFSKNYPNTNEVIDLIQLSLKCCGTDGPSFWGSAVPASCYPDKNTQERRFDRGCGPTMADFVWSSIQVIAIVALGISVVEVIGAVLAFCLSGCIKERSRQTAYY